MISTQLIACGRVIGGCIYHNCHDMTHCVTYRTVYDIILWGISYSTVQYHNAMDA